MDLPDHIALIPDGNRRWSKLHGVPALEGHNRGAEVMHAVVEHLIEQQVKYLTVWGFSTDNWKRSENEVQNIFNLLGLWVEKDTPWLNERGVKLRHIGRLHYIDESSITRYLDTDGMPDVDLVIRTAGEVRLSNFLLWQTAYSEFYFTKVLWPDFSTVELDLALQEYSRRKRRFGGD
ncbi:Isoprenyl transferase [subsurface metagenome]